MTRVGYAFYEGPEGSVDDLAAFLFGHGHALRQLDARYLLDLGHRHQIKQGRAVVVISPRDESMAAEKELARLVESAGLDFNFLNRLVTPGTYGVLRNLVSGEAMSSLVITAGEFGDSDSDYRVIDPAAVYFEPLVPPVPEERT